MAGTGEKNQIIDLHELCIEGDFAELKSALNSSKDIDVNQYKLFVYRPLANSSKEVDDSLDVEDDYQSDEDVTDSGTMFDYRSPLFYAILHDR
ncbi:unnamed protein product, partial [Rotaria sp. Silwood2]